MIAVILRDMRTRFFNHGLGFMLVALWPLVHMGVLISIHTVSSHSAPLYGESAALFYATGLVPTLTFMYVSRFMGLSVIMNRPMLAFPEVKVLDVMMGRALLEIIASCITLTLIITILWALGQNPFPYDLNRAVGAYLATILLAYGCGTLIGVISLFMPFIVTLYQLTLITLYVSSGTMFVASNLPDPLSGPLSYNPVLVCVEWMRTAFYESYSDKLVSKEYVLAFGVVTLCLGLGVERLFRRQLLEA
ncbi:capsular biosynthesis protein [Rhizobium rhizogenes]|jgi:capsular polysaccharide transport system permease protein|uniref:ABC transporter permease n=1 Tax=Rhizobium rhizogenes TaxID=359 RepID=UPI000691C1C3|nr:capsular biosynthesis protein [Rhizobium rhizogenes]